MCALKCTSETYPEIEGPSHRIHGALLSWFPRHERHGIDVIDVRTIGRYQSGKSARYLRNREIHVLEEY